MSKKLFEIFVLSFWVCLIFLAVISGLLNLYDVTLYMRDICFVFLVTFIVSLFVVVTLYDSIKKND